MRAALEVEFPPQVLSCLLDTRTLRRARRLYVPATGWLATALPSIVSASPRTTFLLGTRAGRADGVFQQGFNGQPNVEFVAPFDPFEPRLPDRIDWAFLIAPLGARSREIPAASLAGRHLDAFTIERLVQSLPLGAHLLAVTGAAVLFVPALQPCRTWLASNFTVNSIRRLPAGTLAPYTSVKLVVLDVTKQPPRPGDRCEVVAYRTLRPVTARKGFRDNPISADRRRLDPGSLLRRPTWSVESLLPSEGGRVVAAHRPGVPTVPLGSVVETTFGGIYLQPGELWSGEKGATHALVDVGNVQGGRLLLDSPRWLRLSDPNRRARYEVRPGDLVVTARGTRIKLAVVPPFRKPLIISNNLVAVRVGKTYDPTCLRIYLEGPVGARWLEGSARTSYVKVISPRDLKGIPVPLLPLAEQKRIAARALKSESDARAAIERAVRRRDAVLQELHSTLGHVSSTPPHRVAR